MVDSLYFGLVWVSRGREGEECGGRRQAGEAERGRGEGAYQCTLPTIMEAGKPSPTHARSGVGGGGFSMQQLQGWNGT